MFNIYHMLSVLSCPSAPYSGVLQAADVIREAGYRAASSECPKGISIRDV